MPEPPSAVTTVAPVRRLSRSTIMLLVTIAVVLVAILARFLVFTGSGSVATAQGRLTLAHPTALPQATGTASAGQQGVSGTVVAGATPFAEQIIPGYAAPNQDTAQERALRAQIGNPTKVIMVSIDGQFLQAWDHGKLVRWTYVTTGRPGMDTPRGFFNIFQKQTPLTFIPLSTDPASKYFEYASVVTYGMEFAQGGYYIHDAWWRTVWGPGKTDWHWDPGRLEYADGSHGCVNTPLEVMTFLYTWADIGTPVIVF